MPTHSHTPKTTAQWLEYFKTNERSVQDMPWELPVQFSGADRVMLLESIRAFQRGESSEGNNLLHFARQYAEKNSDPDYVACTQYFIREEQKHAGFLALYLQKIKATCLQKTFTDSVFRGMRKYVGLEVSLRVLITAEIIAIAYYSCLKAATICPLLQAICDRILADERVHLIYQSERIALIARHHSDLFRVILNGAQRFLFLGTVITVWVVYRKAFITGGITSFCHYWKAQWANFEPCAAIMRGV